MSGRKGFLWAALALGCTMLAAGIVVSAQLVRPRPAEAPAQQPSLGQEGAPSLIVLAWNDLGMHCYNNDAEHLLFLPPYNTLWAQVIRPGNPPTVVTTGVTVSYSFADNTYSVGKTNFWSYAQQAFGLAEPLPPNIGLTGKGLAGDMDAQDDFFVAKGIPLTEYSDSELQNRQPYQLATVIVRDAESDVELARTTAVAPVSSEMSCGDCHSDDGDATAGMMSGNAITPTGNTDTNILAMHDLLTQGQYPAGHEGALLDPARQPVLCAECHGDNALGAVGLPGVSSLSNAMHRHHAPFDEITPDTDGCQKCHPGAQTQCLRDVMTVRMGDYGFSCVNCHGEMAAVSQNPNPWLNEPRCDVAQCHGTGVRQSAALYRLSKGHGGVYCEGCHDSTHAIAPSREPNDAIKFVDLQGHSGTLSECGVCHTGAPTGTFSHVSVTGQSYLQVVTR